MTLIFWLFLLFASNPGYVFRVADSTGSPGCLLNSKLCDEDEFCTDDGILGRCVSIFDEQLDPYVLYDGQKSPELVDNSNTALQRAPRLRKIRILDDGASMIDGVAQLPPPQDRAPPPLTAKELDQLNANILSMKNNQRPDFSGLSDEVLQKHLEYVPDLSRKIRELDQNYDDYDQLGYTHGQVISDSDKFFNEKSDEEKFLFKKDKEKLGLIDQGTANKVHKIQTRFPGKVTPSPINWNFAKFSLAIHGNRVYLRLNKKFTKFDGGYLHNLTNFLDGAVARPNNLTFANYRVNKNELSFDVYYKHRQATPQEVQYAFDFPAPMSYSEEAQEEAYLLTKKTESLASNAASSAKLVDASNIEENDKILLPTVIVCLVVICSLISVMTLYVCHMRSDSRKKFSFFRNDYESKPSKDYQDLCRQHMNGRGADDRVVENLTGPGIVGTLAQRLGSQSEPSPPAASSGHSSTSSWSEEPVQTNMDITTGHTILTYMEKHLLDKNMLNQEWENLEKYEPDVSATNVGSLAENLVKNRYRHVLPYDHSRVKLLDLSTQNVSDYINANFICDHDPRSPAYIATQGPLPDTAPDFWQMVWEQGGVVLVNLTKLTENGLPKCTRYWPENGSEVHRCYEVHLVSEHIWCTDYLVRSFYLKNLRTHETRTVTQFHFLTWPEDGLPVSTKSLLDFRRKVNKSFRGRLCPIVVHCSDGSSRTGTYCLLDMVLNRINKGIKEIDIAATLEHLRDQRMKFVKSVDQFEFVLTCVAEEVQAVLRALPQ